MWKNVSVRHETRDPNYFYVIDKKLKRWVFLI